MKQEQPPKNMRLVTPEDGDKAEKVGKQVEDIRKAGEAYLKKLGVKPGDIPDVSFPELAGEEPVTREEQAEMAAAYLERAKKEIAQHDDERDGKKEAQG